MKFLNRPLFIVATYCVVSPLVLVHACGVGIRFPNVDKNACRKPAYEEMLGIVSMVYEFSSEYEIDPSRSFVHFSVPNRPDFVNIFQQPDDLLRPLYVELFERGQKRAKGLSKNNSGGPRQLTETNSVRRNLCSSKNCEFCCDTSKLCYIRTGCEPYQCGCEEVRRNLRAEYVEQRNSGSTTFSTNSTKSEQRGRALKTLQDADPNCDMNPITFSSALTDLIHNSHFGYLNCLRWKDYQLLLGERYYDVIVDEITGQQITINDLGVFGSSV